MLEAEEIHKKEAEEADAQLIKDLETITQ